MNISVLFATGNFFYPLLTKGFFMSWSCVVLYIQVTRPICERSQKFEIFILISALCIPSWIFDVGLFATQYTLFVAFTKQLITQITKAEVFGISIDAHKFPESKVAISDMVAYFIIQVSVNCHGTLT